LPNMHEQQLWGVSWKSVAVTKANFSMVRPFKS
jgi:hypothetical protein